jgi:TQXA domain-containing protein
MRKLWAGLAVVATFAALTVGVAQATWDPDRVEDPGNGPAQLVMSGTGAGHGVLGFIGPVGSVSDPSVPYPTTNPSAPFTPLNEGFAGIVLGDPGVGPDVKLFCINIRVNTFGGVGYDLGTWDAANVPNVGYVARLLNEYYPTVPDQPPLVSENDRAAAVQAAIWYFSDNYVLNTSDPLHDTVAAIVNNVIAQGPLVEPPPPNLQIDPETASGPIGSLVGPFTIVSPQEPAIVSATGGDMFADPNGLDPIANGTAVPDGTDIYLRRLATGSATLTAQATAIVPTGNVYLYAHNIPGVDDAQKLILAESGEVSTTVSATADFVDTAALTVTKVVDGQAAGIQSDVHISVTCNDAPLPDFVIPAGSSGSVSRTYEDVVTPATCVITETVDGLNPLVTVTTTNPSQTIDLPQTEVRNDPVSATPVVNTYQAVAAEVIVVPSPLLVAPRFTG